MKEKTTPHNTISMNDVKRELGAKRSINLNHPRVRALANKNSGQIALSDLRGKTNKPHRPAIQEKGYGAVRMTSDRGTWITYNGQSKVSGSWWYYSGVETLDANAHAYWPEDNDFYQSQLSDGLNIKILGRPADVGGDGDESSRLYNNNNTYVEAYQRSTRYTIRSGRVSDFSDLYSKGDPVGIGANTYNWIFDTRSNDGFDSDENRTGRHLSGNTYSWFQKGGYISSAIAQLIYNHKDYRIGQVIHNRPNFK